MPDPLLTGNIRTSGFAGRRKGKPLSKYRTELVESLLPQLAVPALSGDSLVDLETLFGDFPPTAPLWLEIGYGGGEHLAAQARQQGDVRFLGAEPFINGTAALLAQISGSDSSNIRLWQEDARLLIDSLPDSCLDRVFLLFPDPWPKSRHHKRRFVSASNLDALARVMKVGAEFIFASDHLEYTRWSLSHLLRHPDFEWTARRPDDWRNRPACEGVATPQTRYESKALARGDKCIYLRFQRH